MRQNYVVQRALDNEIKNYDYGVPKYSMDPMPGPAASEDLPAFIVDYANMIRNDIILLDNSVETRTRKRGNINVEEHGVSTVKQIDSCTSVVISVIVIIIIRYSPLWPCGLEAVISVRQ